MNFDHRIYRDLNTGLIVDLSHAPPVDLSSMPAALTAMAELEAGATANPDEGRMVGHYWLRTPTLAPTPALASEIADTIEQIQQLDPGDHTDVLWIGIGGSGLGPQLIDHCLRTHTTPLRVHFLDNTDPNGIAHTLAPLQPSKTLVVVVSKSGGTVETRNGLMAAQSHWADAGEAFATHAIAITVEGSALWKQSTQWRQRVRLWDWVGGRTSITGAVGGVLMALCGYDFGELLAGAAAVDALTRSDAQGNPAALLAAAWHAAGAGRGERALVMEPYVDRFSLLSKYLQQLVMESLGKKEDRNGRPVWQGLTVYGNKGSTDQHAFVQQLRDGRDDAFVHFVSTTAVGPALQGVDGHQTGDHLLGFLCGTEHALHSVERPSLTLQVPDASARSLGMLIALFERAVGIYAELINVNAYHQPGVEAGKGAAKAILSTLQSLQSALDDTGRDAAELAAVVGAEPRLCWRLLHHLAASQRAAVVAGTHPAADRFRRADSASVDHSAVVP